MSLNSSMLRPLSEIRRNDGGKLSDAQDVAETVQGKDNLTVCVVFVP